MRQTVLNESEVAEIRHFHDTEGYNDAELSREYGVSRKTIYNIVNRLQWKNVPDPVTVRGYKGYTVFPDGRVLSKATGTFMTPIKRKNGQAVKLVTSSGQRRTVPVATLLKKGYGN